MISVSPSILNYTILSLLLLCGCESRNSPPPQKHTRNSQQTLGKSDEEWSHYIHVQLASCTGISQHDKLVGIYTEILKSRSATDALSFIIKEEPSRAREQILDELFIELARKAPDWTLEWFTTAHPSYHVKTSSRSFGKEYAKLYPQKAYSTLLKNTYGWGDNFKGVRSGMLQNLVSQKNTGYSLEELVSLIHTNKTGLAEDMVDSDLNDLVYYGLEKFPKKDLAYLSMNVNNETTRSSLTAIVLTHWARENPEEALIFTTKLPLGQIRTVGLEKLFSTWVSMHPRAAIKAILELPDFYDRVGIHRHLVGDLAFMNVEENAHYQSKIFRR